MGRVYVNQQLGDDFNPGSEFLPLMTLKAAFSSPANNEIFIEDGIYSEIIDAGDFDRVRRKVVGLGDVYFTAQGNPSSFIGKLANSHVFKNIKFVNYSHHALEFAGGNTILSSCFFKPIQKTGSRAIFINPPISTNVTALDIRKCTFISNEILFDIALTINMTALSIKNMVNNLYFDHVFQIKQGANTDSFSTFLTAAQDKGNYYNNNIHLANGGINSTIGENPPLFVDPSNGDYDLLPSSTLIGAGYLGSDIGSFHELVPFNSTTDEPITLFDAGWMNDNRYYDLLLTAPGPDGPPDAAAIIQITLDGKPRWIIDVAQTPAGKSGRLISPVFDMKLIRTITRASWAAEEDITPVSGSKKILNNSNILVPDLEIRADVSAFTSSSLTPAWIPFDRATSIGILAKYVQFRAVFRLDGV